MIWLVCTFKRPSTDVSESDKKQMRVWNFCTSCGWFEPLSTTTTIIICASGWTIVCSNRNYNKQLYWQSFSRLLRRFLNGGYRRRDNFCCEKLQPSTSGLVVMQGSTRYCGFSWWLKTYGKKLKISKKHSDGRRQNAAGHWKIPQKRVVINTNDMEDTNVSDKPENS